MIGVPIHILEAHEQDVKANAAGFHLWATRDDAQVIAIHMSFVAGLGRALDYYRELDEKELWPDSHEAHAVRLKDGAVFYLNGNEDWVGEDDPTWCPMPV